MEALFGPLSRELSDAERLEIYSGMLSEHEQQLGEDHGALSLFLRSLLPWNSLRDMALSRGLAENGVEDPVIALRRANRQHEEQLVRTIEAREDRMEDEEASEEDDE